jgi:hypothetical protein
MATFIATNAYDGALTQVLSRLSVQCCVRGEMDAISADALSARGVVLDQEGYIASERQLAQPEVKSGVGLGAILAKQDASHIRKLDDFGQRSLDRGRSVGRKREIEPTGRRRFSHFAASACLSLRNGAVLSVSVSNHAGRGAVNVRQGRYPSVDDKGRVGVQLLVDHWRDVHHIVTWSPSRGSEGRHAALGGEAGAVRGHSS